MNNHGIDRRAPEWDPIRNLFAAHLHQDYDAVHGDAWGAVRDFAAGTSPERLATASRGIRRLLAMFDDDEEELADAAEWLGMDYYPPGAGYTYRQWLEEVAEFLEGQCPR